MVKTQQRFAIYLPNDTEKWFNIHFSSKDRAYWFAEANDLTPDDYEVRPTNVILASSTEVSTEVKAVA